MSSAAPDAALRGRPLIMVWLPVRVLLGPTNQSIVRLIFVSQVVGRCTRSAMGMRATEVWPVARVRDASKGAILSQLERSSIET